ncbi:2,3-diaminopropionate biosynthesis protein SbnB [Paraburkholderia solisilvae]|uniref:N-((2S)-2-amino-2-carboxyethyl)-L-glutamate dehydrogenase n=1 Tax=Paraburkholderia solisilvae TaxID=624376 RepID=A0A6J5E109_9BURK|nr:2,3-diaminopropionate biosynthesis protein SbnB [Paraburkholderia solisilvae]CAB3759983.1 N-((2S)-2-amino-2-carboxyethyl)-L-glutamate dehydrogenase [Paraburkholderia solisilvae]
MADVVVSQADAAALGVDAVADLFAFGIIPGDVVSDIVTSSFAALVEIVRDAYLAHADGVAHNPPSTFLRFADRPRDRIIALPADLGAGIGLAGIKWIASWPENVEYGLPRASALLVLNRRETGYPLCLMEASIISAARTAASAVLGLRHLGEGRLPSRPKLGFVGCGVIARNILDMIVACGFEPATVCAYDLAPEDARRMLERAGPSAAPEPAGSVEEIVRGSDAIVFATTAARPYVMEPHWFEHAPVVLNISLRDLAPEVILAADNVVDDVDHCLQADTSPHLAEQQSGHRRFITGTIAGAVRGELSFNAERPVVYSPFGMGILDLAVGRFVDGEARRSGRIIQIPNFFAEKTRW